MIRTTVYLEEDVKERLAVVAEATGVSEAELIRRGVRLVITGARPRPRTGFGRSSDGRAARDTDQLFAETGFAGT